MASLPKGKFVLALLLVVCMSTSAVSHELVTRPEHDADIQTLQQSVDALDARLGVLENATPEPTPEPVPPGCPADLAPLCTLVDGMEPGTWLEIENTSLQPVAVTLAELTVRCAADPNCTDPGRTWGVQGIPAVVDNWCGMAFDGRAFYLNCGGHSGYGGNEVYKFDLRTLAWTRLTEPGLMPDATPENACPMPLSGPIAVHTYDGLIYHPDRGTIFRFLGAAYCYEGWWQNQTPWEFNPATGKWTALNVPITGNFPIGAKTIFDPVTSRIIIVDQKQSFAYDPADGTIKFGNQGDNVAEGNMALDPSRRRTVIVSASGLSIVDIAGDIPGPPTRFAPSGDVPASFGEGWGMSYDAAADRFLLWSGSREIYALDAETGEMTLYPNAVGPAPPPSNKVFSKWECLEELDACVGYNNWNSGVWIYRPTSGQQTGSEPIQGLIRVCPPENFTLDCDAQSITEAGLLAQDNDTITVRAGVYESPVILRANNLTIQAEPGAHLRNGVAEGKAAIVVKGNDTVIEGLECSGIWVSAGNGACIRLEGTNLTLRNVNFHDSQEGILAGGECGDVLIEDSLFERLGGAEDIALGRAHAIYISCGNSLTIRNSRILSSKEEGHEVKSRAVTTLIENNVIASLDGIDSRLIDVPNGGVLIVRDNILEMGPNTSNPDLIGYGLEGIGHLVNTISITGNTIIIDRSPSVLLRATGATSTIGEGNKLIGGDPVSGNEWFPDREAAGLGPYPALPQVN